MPVVKATAPYRHAQTVVCAVAGYHSEANLKGQAERGIDAFMCDNGYRARDPRYAQQAQHRAKSDPLWDKTKKPKKTRCFTPAEFQLGRGLQPLHLPGRPAGKKLYSNGSNCTFNGYAVMKFRGADRDCLPCELRAHSLRTPDTTKTRQVAFFQGKRPGQESHTERTKVKIDSDTDKRMIAARFVTVEPVFGNLRHDKRVTRFTLRGRTKVDGECKLYCLVHNIEKLAHGNTQSMPRPGSGSVCGQVIRRCASGSI